MSLFPRRACPAGRPAPCGDENKIPAAHPCPAEPIAAAPTWCRRARTYDVAYSRACVRQFVFYLRIYKLPRAASVSRNRAKVMPPCAAHVCCLCPACRGRLFWPYRRAVPREGVEQPRRRRPEPRRRGPGRTTDDDIDRAAAPAPCFLEAGIRGHSGIHGAGPSAARPESPWCFKHVLNLQDAIWIYCFLNKKCPCY